MNDKELQTKYHALMSEIVAEYTDEATLFMVAGEKIVERLFAGKDVNKKSDRAGDFGFFDGTGATAAMLMVPLLVATYATIKTMKDSAAADENRLNEIWREHLESENVSPEQARSIVEKYARKLTEII